MHFGKRKLSSTVFDVLNISGLLFLSVLFILPFWQQLVLSFLPPEESSGLVLNLFPKHVSLEAYETVFRSSIILIGYYNTVFRTAIGTLLTVAVTAAMAYSLSKRALPGRNYIMTFVLITMFFSGGLIPTYLQVKRLGLVDTRWALILPVLTTAWYIILGRNFFLMIPSDVEDSAYVDGSGFVQTFVRIVIPLSLPILAVIGLFSAVRHWNAWFDALIYVRGRNKMVLQLILRRILVEARMTDSDMMLIDMDMVTKVTPESIRAATIMVAIGPIILVYPFVQKFFVKGIFVGSLKG